MNISPLKPILSCNKSLTTKEEVEMGMLSFAVNAGTAKCPTIIPLSLLLIRCWNGNMSMLSNALLLRLMSGSAVCES